jgi:hypothetical protein
MKGLVALAVFAALASTPFIFFVQGQGTSFSNPILIPIGGGTYHGSLPTEGNYGACYNATLYDGETVNVTLLTNDTEWKLMIYGPSSPSQLVPPGIIGNSTRTEFTYTVNGWPGNYTIEVYRNSLAQGNYTLIVDRRLGDLNNDGRVDMRDIAIVAYAFGSYPGQPRWNPQADINQDGKVDMVDVALVAMNFGKH